MRVRRSAATGQETDTARLARERDEALEREKATAEVLRVISSSPGELQTVFQTILENATRICEAKFGMFFRYDRGAFHTAAALGLPPEYAEFLRGRAHFLSEHPHNPLSRVASTKEVLLVSDIAAYPAYLDRNPGMVALVELAGARTLVTVPMLKDSVLIGAMTVYRQEVRPFTEKQIALLKAFAAQAVIAIENTRLLNELRESLQQQTATADVLRVISSSPGELEPVFQAILENATRICEAKFANLFLYEDNSFRIAAQQHAPPAYAERWRHRPVLRVADNPRNPLARLAVTKGIIDIPDLMTEPGYVERDPRFVTLVESAGARTLLAVPMLKDDELVGAITIYRQEVRPFTDKQIALVANFAAQAVIAIENTRLLNELRQRRRSLRVTRTADGDHRRFFALLVRFAQNLQPVFQAMMANATRICEAKCRHPATS